MEAAAAASPYDLSTAPSVCSTARIVVPSKDTMDNLRIVSLNHGHSVTSVPSKSSEMYELSAKSSLPAWTAPLKKALAVEVKKAPTQPANISAQINTTTTKSVPPHLRKSIEPVKGNSRPGLVPATKGFEPKKDEHNTMSRQTSAPNTAEILVNKENPSDEALAWKLAVTDIGRNYAHEVG